MGSLYDIAELDRPAWWDLAQRSADVLRGFVYGHQAKPAKLYSVPLAGVRSYQIRGLEVLSTFLFCCTLSAIAVPC